MKDPAILATVAAIITAFGVTMLFFRIQREISIKERQGINWIPYSDWLLITATVMSLLLVILPIVIFSDKSFFYTKLPKAACATVTIMVAGYMFGILAHYRLIFGKNRQRLRQKGEPSEKVIVLLTTFVACLLFVFLLAY